MKQIFALALSLLFLASSANAYNEPVTTINGASVPTSAPLLSTDANGHLIGAPAQSMATNLANASASTLPHWKAALARVTSGTGNATLYVGPSDSTMCGYNSNVSPNPFLASPPAQLAAAFNAAGVPTNFETKIGFQSVADPRYSTGSWSLGSPYTIGGNDNLYATSSSAGTITFTTDINVDTFKIFYYSGGAAGVGSYSIDGGTAVNFTVSATKGVYTAVSSPVALGIHTISINWVSGVVGFAGVQAYDSSKKQLFIVDGCFPGSNTANWNTTTGAQNGIQTISYLNQDLTIIDLGINDQGQGVSVSAFTTNMQALITQAKTVGDVMLVTSIPVNPGVAVSTGTAPSNAVQQTYVNAESSLATSNNTAVANVFGNWQSYVNESPYGYYNADGVHPLPVGIADETNQLFQLLNYNASGSVLGSSITGQAPTTFVSASGSAQAVIFPANGDNAYDVTLSANCMISVTLPTTNTFHRSTLIIRPNGYTATLPASSASLVWAGGSAPSVSTSAVTVITFASDGTAPIVGGL